jgi:hypothetical protein
LGLFFPSERAVFHYEQQQTSDTDDAPAVCNKHGSTQLTAFLMIVTNVTLDQARARVHQLEQHPHQYAKVLTAMSAATDSHRVLPRDGPI